MYKMGTILSNQGKQSLEQEVPTFKIVLVGEPGVGKSSVFLRYTKNQFDYSYQPSVSVAIGNVVKKINIPYQGVVSVVIWDVPGREEMDLRKSYYKDVDAVIVVVDVSEPDTIGLAPTWKQDVLNHAQFTVESSVSQNGISKENFMTHVIPVLLLGNKADKIEAKDGGEHDNDEHSESSTTIKELEETALKHGFIGSVTVSAKEGDGSVHAAVQTLIRHLLQKRKEKGQKEGTLRNLFNSGGKKQGEWEGNEVENEKPFLPFLKVNINELDDLFNLCEQPMKTVEECTREYFKALHTFKRRCCVADLVPSSKSSLEECITGLKEGIVDKNDECGLKAVDDGGFVNFVIVDDVIEDISGPVNKILRLFHTRLAVAAKDILSKCSVAHGTLKNAEKQLDDLLNSFKELAKSCGLSEKLQRKSWVDVQANRTRLAEAGVAAMESLQAVENDCKKIKAAILW